MSRGSDSSKCFTLVGYKVIKTNRVTLQDCDSDGNLPTPQCPALDRSRRHVALFSASCSRIAQLRQSRAFVDWPSSDLPKHIDLKGKPTLATRTVSTGLGASPTESQTKWQSSSPRNSSAASLQQCRLPSLPRSFVPTMVIAERASSQNRDCNRGTLFSHLAEGKPNSGCGDHISSLSSAEKSTVSVVPPRRSELLR